MGWSIVLGQHREQAGEWPYNGPPFPQIFPNIWSSCSEALNSTYNSFYLP